MNPEDKILGTKYSKIYFQIISKARFENRAKKTKDDILYIYYENHHILPKSIFPDYIDLRKNEWNSVLLTAREHYICHMLLVKHYNDMSLTFEHRKMSHALKQLNGNGLYTSRLYENLQKDFKFTQEHKDNISKATLGKKKSKYIKNALSEEHKDNISKAKIGSKHSLDTKKKISKGNKGKILSDEHIDILKMPKSLNHKMNISKSLKGNTNGAKIIHIFDSDDNLMFECNRGFGKFCKENNLPCVVLTQSYIEINSIYTNLKPNSLSRVTNSGMIKYKGWYARLATKSLSS